MQELLKHEIKGIEYRVENIKLRCEKLLGDEQDDKQGAIRDKVELTENNQDQYDAESQCLYKRNPFDLIVSLLLELIFN